MKPLILGEAPSRTGDDGGDRPLAGRPATVLLQLMMPRTRFWHDDPYRWLTWMFDVANLLDRYPGANGRGAAFPSKAAREAAERRRLQGVVILLGQRLAHIYGVPYCRRYYGWTWLGDDALVMALPHPSGLNYLYNDPGIRAQVGDVLWSALGVR